MPQFKPCERAGGWLRLQCRVCLKYLKVYLEAEAALCLQRFFFDRCSRGIAIPTLLHPPVVLGRVPCGSLAHRRDPRACMCAGRFDETQSILDRLHVY